MEVSEAEKIIKNSFLFKDANEHIQLKEAISAVLQANELARKTLIENSNIADERNDLLVEVQKLKKENEKLKEIDLTTVHIKGVCDEKARWRNKIKDKLEKIKNPPLVIVGGRRNGKTLAYGKQLGKIEILEELLKGE